jgi:hypothetical protein
VENKKLTLEIEPAVLAVLKNNLHVKCICGEYSLDAFGELAFLILNAIDAGEPTLIVRRVKSC